MPQEEEHSKINQEKERNTSGELLPTNSTVVGDTLPHGQPIPQNCGSTTNKEYGREQAHESSVQLQNDCEPGETPDIQENVPKKDYRFVDDVVLVQKEDNKDYKRTSSTEPSIEPAQGTLVGTDVTDYEPEKRRRRSSSDRTCDNIIDCMIGCCYCLLTCLEIALCCLGEDP